MLKSTIDSEDLDSGIVYPWFCSQFKEPLFHTFADPALISWFYNERLVSFSLYHYTASAFFFNGFINKENFGLRKATSFDNNSDFGLRNVLSLVNISQIKISPVVRSTKSNNFNILLDTLFESVDFKHSYLLNLYELYSQLLLLFLF